MLNLHLNVCGLMSLGGANDWGSSWQDLSAQSSSSPAFPGVPSQDLRQQLLKGKKWDKKGKISVEPLDKPILSLQEGQNWAEMSFCALLSRLERVGSQQCPGAGIKLLRGRDLEPGEGRAQAPSISGCSEPEPCWTQCCAHIPSHLLLMQVPLQDQQKFIPPEWEA